MESSAILYYSGIVLISCTSILGIITAVIFSVKARHLKKELDREYGAREKKKSP